MRTEGLPEGLSTGDQVRPHADAGRGRWSSACGRGAGLVFVRMRTEGSEGTRATAFGVRPHADAGRGWCSSACGRRSGLVFVRMRTEGSEGSEGARATAFGDRPHADGWISDLARGSERVLSDRPHADECGECCGRAALERAGGHSSEASACGRLDFGPGEGHKASSF